MSLHVSGLECTSRPLASGEAAAAGVEPVRYVYHCELADGLDGLGNALMAVKSGAEFFWDRTIILDGRIRACWMQICCPL